MLHEVLHWESACEGQKGRAVDLARSRAVQEVWFVELVTPGMPADERFVLPETIMRKTHESAGIKGGGEVTASANSG